jgi:tetratricopeptide (TPR) repeat protein
LARYDDASQCLDKAIDIFRSNYGENHVEIAKCYSDYGQLNAARAAYDQAWEYQEKAVSIVKSVCGEKSEELAKLYHLSADLCYRQNRVYDKYDECKMGEIEYEKAMEYCSHALSIYLQLVGTYHQNVARLYWLMGLLDATQNGMDAKTYYMQARRIFEKINGRNCVEVAKICLDLSSLLDVEFLTQDKLYREEALEIMIAATGKDSLYTADCYVLLAETCSHYSEKEDAAEYYEKALNIYISHYGENSQEVLNVYVALYDDCIRFDTNRNNHKDVLDKMLQISMSVNGEADELALLCQQHLGNLYYEDGVGGKTLEYWDKKLQTEILYHGENSEVVAETYIAYGEFYNHHNEYERAVDYLTKAYEIYVGIYGNKDIKAQNISRQIKFIKNERMPKKSFFSRIFGK